jgi:hypothetical protein
VGTVYLTDRHIPIFLWQEHWQGRDRLCIQRCEFDGIKITPDAYGERHMVVEGVEISDSRVGAATVRGAYFKDCSVSNLRLNKKSVMHGCLFEHVTLAGKIREVGIYREMVGVWDPKPFNEFADFVWAAQTEWALDISNLDCPDVDIRGIPSRLMHLDPEYQAVVSADAARSGAWNKIDLGETGFNLTIWLLEMGGWEDIVLAAPRTGRSRDAKLRAIDLLRKAGVAN